MPSSIRPMRDSSLRMRAAPEEVSIVDWPLRDRPLASSLALTMAAGASWLAVWATNSAMAGVIVVVLLVLTLWRTWLPAQYQFGSRGVVQSVLSWRRRIAWTAIRRYELRDDGVLLLPDPFLTPLSPLRGLYVRWGTHHDAVLAQLEYHLLGRSKTPILSRPAAPAAEQPADSSR